MEVLENEGGFLEAEEVVDLFPPAPDGYDLFIRRKSSRVILPSGIGPAPAVRRGEFVEDADGLTVDEPPLLG